jgi:hypothetical protein
MKEADLFRQYAKEATRWSSLPRSFRGTKLFGG